MGGTLIGVTSWVLRPGGSETPGDDGSVEIVRVYNGALTGWKAFRDSMPVGTVDPVYGSAAVSTAKPSLVEARNLTGVATVTFVGGLFEPGQTTTPPQVSISRVWKTLGGVLHPTWQTSIQVSYLAWQTDVSYTKKGTPSDTGAFSRLAKATLPLITEDDVKQTVPSDFRDMTTAELQANIQVFGGGTPAVRLTDIKQNKRSGDGGSQIWDVVETWLMGLELA